MTREGFFDVPRTLVRTSQGPIELPILYREAAGRLLNYFVDYDRVPPLLTGTGLVPCRFFNGKAMVILAFFQYRHTSIGSYDEAALVVMALPEAFPQPYSFLANFLKKNGHRWTMGGYVLEMPVTSSGARAAGREVWGYPKFETGLPFRLSGSEYAFSVLDPNTGDPIVDLKGSAGAGFPARGFDYVTFSNHGDRILKTVVDVDGSLRACLNREVKMEILSVNHRLARNLKELGLDGLQPFLVLCGDSFRTRLNPGVPVAVWKTSPRPYPVEGEFETALECP